MYNIVNNGNITTSQDFISIVVTPNDVYALSFQNINSFVNFGNMWLSNSILFGGFDDEMSRNTKGGYNINLNNTNSNNEKNFIKMLQHRQMNVQIHKANTNASQWSRLTINPLTNNVTPIPCN